ncbi:hypothetical protein D6833_11285 [Candidatus Parcubacteria bacterium]|nr:MAG: hypothetical protein D6833_11285 [Candidatus Parcubacteria bacterium]
MVLKIFRKLAPELEAPKGWSISRTAAELLEPHRALLHEIRQYAGVTDQVWDACYSPAYRNFATLVQSLPASEAHHHAEPGGLLRHGLEVSLEALRIRQGHLLPPGEPPEQINARQDIWTYCCAMGGLLHDAGKPLIDQQIILENGESWTLLSGPMKPGTVYRIRFRPNRAHRAHERATSLLANQILPQAGLLWIASDTEALLAWLAALGGDMENAGLLGSILSRADQRSVAQDLARGIPSQIADTRARPLSEVLLNGLRELLRSGALPINRPGAAAFLAGQDLWLVSKRVLDALREFLTRDGQGIPSRNDRLMDELQQHGLLIPHQGKAIWKCDIRLEDWNSTLTCLRMPAHFIWPDSEESPPDFKGTIVPASQDEAIEDSSESESRGDAKVNAPVLPDPSEDLPMPPLAEDSASAHQDEPVEIQESRGSDSDEHTHEGSRVEADQPPPKTNRGTGEKFVDWLRDQINNGTAKINTVDARIHVVPEGLVLVSPAIFRDYDAVNWRAVQRHFQRMKLHKKLPDETNIWTFRVEKDRKRSELKAYLIPKAEEKLGVRLPPPNKAVHLMELSDQAESHE